MSLDRRRFLFICGAAAAGLLLPSVGLVAVSSTMVLRFGGSCSFCHKAAGEVQALAGISDRDVRVCDECLRLCLDILTEHQTPAKPPRRPPPTARDVRRQERGWSDADVEAFFARLDARAKAPLPAALTCSFCDQGQHAVDKMIAGPSVYICDGCIADGGTLLVWSGIAPA